MSFLIGFDSGTARLPGRVVSSRGRAFARSVAALRLADLRAIVHATALKFARLDKAELPERLISKQGVNLYVARTGGSAAETFDEPTIHCSAS